MPNHPSLPHPETTVPYAFETVHRDSGGGEVARLEAQNLLLEKQGALAHLPPVPPTGRVLDVGSGTGFWSLRLAVLVPDGEVVCLDRSLDLLDHARARLDRAGIQHARYLQQDLRTLELPEDAFDLVFTCVTLTHVEELESVLQKLTASLKPGGWMVCFEPLQNQDRLFHMHPPCPSLERIMDRMAEVARERGSDLSVGLKIAHHLEALGMVDVSVPYFGAAAHGEDCRAWIEDVFLPIARTYLVARMDPLDLGRLLEAAAQEAARPFMWADLKRAAILGRKPE